MKMVSKRSLKKKIFTVAGILATCMLCVGIAIAMLTKADAADVIELPAKVDVGNHTYDKDNPLVVLEIVPHVAYDELGFIAGDSTGSLSWDMIVEKAPKGKENADALNAYIGEEVRIFDDYVKVLVTPGDCKMYYENKLDSTGKTVYTLREQITAEAIDYDLKNLERVLYEKVMVPQVDSSGNEVMVEAYEKVGKLSDGTSVKNYFAYKIFGDTNMEDKIKIVPKVADKVTKEDIDNAGLVYICGTSHNGSTFDLYEKLTGDTVARGHGAWELGGVDLAADVAMYLQMESVINRKALIIGSTDKSAYNNVHSNIARICLLQCGIDSDVFVMDFAYELEKDKNGKEIANSYVGNAGRFCIEKTKNASGEQVDALKIYLNVDEYYEQQFGVTLKNKVGEQELPFGGDMFVEPSKIPHESLPKNDFTINGVYTWNAYGYAPNRYLSKYVPGYTDEDGNYVPGYNVNEKNLYPAYSADTDKQRFLSKSTYAFNSDNALTNEFGSNEAYKSDYDKDGNYLGSAYGDALFKLDLAEKDLKTPGVIEYILGAYGGGVEIIPVDEGGWANIKVLEIEPAGRYRYYDTNYHDKTLVCKWFGIYGADGSKLHIYDESNKDAVVDDSKFKVKITIDHMSMNAFNGYNGDIRAEYDLVLLGAYDYDASVNGANIKNDGTDSRYNNESGLDGDDKVYNNDLTKKAYEKVIDYLKADMPLVLDKQIYNRKTTAAARDTYVYKLNMYTFSQMFGSAYNIIPADFEAKSEGQRVTDYVKYILKPDVSVRPDGIKDYYYSGTGALDAAMIVQKSNLANMVFKGTVSNVEAFRMKIYVDRDCDSIFNEEFDSDESELVYFAADTVGNAVTNGGKVLGALCSEDMIMEDGKVVPLTGEVPNLCPVVTKNGNKYVEVDASFDSTTNKLTSMELGKKVKYTPKRDEDGNIIAWDVEIPIALPTALNGYMAWKVEIVDDNTGRVNVNTGAFAIWNDTRKTVDVIQIVDNNGKSNIDLQSGGFVKSFENVSKITNMDLRVTKYTKEAFNAIVDKEAELNKYSMLVLGLSDNYGVSKGKLVTEGYFTGDLDAESLDAINAYIDNGNSVLFTHDSMSYKYRAWSTKDEEYEDYEAESYSEFNKFTQMFQTVIGMQDGYALTDPLNMKRKGYTLFNNLTVDGKLTTTRNTDRVSKLNSGEITEYPYKVYDAKLNSSETIRVATTHAQYFKLNLEDLKKLVTVDGETKEVEADDVVVWYTLEQTPSTEPIYDSKGKVITTIDKTSKYFGATGQDAVNNYYVYSVGNITYSSAGHSEITDSTGTSPEMKLFVNTFVRAILSGNSKPEIEYENATKETDTLYSQFYRGKYFPEGIPAGFTAYDTVNTQFTYKITDPDMALGAGRIAEAFLFYDANRNNKYDDGERLCYIGYDTENEKPTYVIDKPSTKSVKNGASYTANLWEIVTKVDVADDTKEAMLEELVKNDLQIGIAAKDSRNAQGYSVLKIIQRDLHYLD
ncbi:MAG: DUF5057 domain-containing protein [Lachnospira sp.]|nr:DUF5057 domain-containing protein [Lachnospira sp.]